MNARRLVALLTAVALVGLPGVVAAPAVAQATVPTEISIDVDSPVTYGDKIHMSGQVSYVEDGEEYALADAKVVLERRYLDSSSWSEIGSYVTAGFWPDYEFEVKAVKGAEYRVSFAGDETYLPSTAKATVRVYRKVGSKVTEPSPNVFYLKGKVAPKYAGKPVFLMRKKCSSCAWTTISSQKSTSTSTYRFRLPLPRSGTHYFRARVPASAVFLKSVSDAWQIMKIL